jgi:carbon starvation protein
MFTFFWGYLLFTGDISTIWPLFGMSNQLLASVGLIIGTVMIIRLGKAKYAWITAVPGVALTCVTMWAGYLSIVDNFLPKKLYLLSTLAIIVMALMTVVIVGAFRRVAKLMKMNKTVPDQYGEPVLEVVQE